MKENIILAKTFEFSVEVSRLTNHLRKRGESVISKQLLRSATSIGANVHEATAAISKKDFILKMSIASKEARESGYWLNLLNASMIIGLDYKLALSLNEEIIKILTAIIKTAQANQSKQ